MEFWPRINPDFAFALRLLWRTQNPLEGPHSLTLSRCVSVNSCGKPLPARQILHFSTLISNAKFGISNV